MRSAQVIYTLRPEATPKTEISTLAAVYHFILVESCASKEGSPAIAAPKDAAKDMPSKERKSM